MPVSIRYENDNHLVVWTFEGKWTLEEYYQHRSHVNKTIEETDGMVDMIVDMTHSSLLPQNLLSQASQAAVKSPTNIGHIVFVGSNNILQAFFNIFRRLYKAVQSDKDTELIMVKTLDEAYAFLDKSRQENNTKAHQW